MITSEILAFGVADNLSMGIIHMTFLRLEKWSSEKRLT
jgi:hypothetical protein